MLKPGASLGKGTGGLLTCLVCALTPLAAHAATNTIIFYDQLVSTTSGNANGPIAASTTPGNNTVISGSSLNAGDVVVYDGIVANTNGTTGDNWGAVEFNGGGYGGMTGATLGVLVRTGNAAGNLCQVYTNAAAGPTFTGSSEINSNHVHVELYCATTGSTTNMGWSVSIDQGLTGSYTTSTNGTNITFANNTINLDFGAANAPEY